MLDKQIWPNMLIAGENRQVKLKLIIQIPCLNEEKQLPETLSELPKNIDGFSKVEWLIIDDGSTDKTSEVAREYGVDHIVRHPQNKGLAAAFQTGLDACIKLGADVVVNTDADNQYNADCIADLTKPILDGSAEMVTGERDLKNHPEFSPLKKQLQQLGSWVVRKASSTDIPDSTSGFRAYNRNAALRLVVVNHYTYTIESIIQAGKENTAIASVPILTNPKTRESRLFKSMWGYIRRNSVTIIRVFAAYEPLKFFGRIALLLFICALLSFMPFILDLIINGDTHGHLQSIILGAILTLASIQVLALGVIADLIYSNRVVTQRLLHKVRRLENAAGLESPYMED